MLRHVYSSKNDKRLTDPAFNHTVSLSPDAKFFTEGDSEAIVAAFHYWGEALASSVT